MPVSTVTMYEGYDSNCGNRSLRTPQICCRSPRNAIPIFGLVEPLYNIKKRGLSCGHRVRVPY